MANPAPSLNIPVSGSPPQATVTLAKFNVPLRLAIPNSAQLHPEGMVYAILGDPEDPKLKGYAIPAGEWASPEPPKVLEEPEEPEELEEPEEPEEPEEGEYQQSQNLTVEVSLAQLQRFAGQTVQLRYQGMGESSLALDSEPIELTII